MNTFPADERDLREAIIATCLRMNREGINQGTAGNVSARWEHGLLLTPSGVPYERLAPADIVFMEDSGNVPSGQKPSSEWRFHLAIMAARADVGAIVHTHSVHATALAMCQRGIPAAHYMVAAAGGSDIRCAPYAPFGSEALSEHAVAALAGRNACLLANHGVIAVGADLDHALWLAIEVETLAQQYILSLSLGGPVLLDTEQMAEVMVRFRDYGLRLPPADPVSTDG